MSVDRRALRVDLEVPMQGAPLSLNLSAVRAPATRRGVARLSQGIEHAT